MNFPYVKPKSLSSGNLHEKNTRIVEFYWQKSISERVFCECLLARQSSISWENVFEQWSCCQTPSNITWGVDLAPLLKWQTIVTFSFVLGSVISLGQILDSGHVVYAYFVETITQFHFPPLITFLSLKLSITSTHSHTLTFFCLIKTIWCLLV